MDMTAMRLGFWPPVYGNWIMTDSPDQGVASYEYVKESTLLAEQLGFDTMLIAEHFIHPIGATLDMVDAWTSAAGLAALTSKIEIIAAVKPGLRAPGVIAKMANSIDHISQGRFAINLVSAWWPPEYEMLGVPVLAHDDRYARAAEYIDILRGLWTRNNFSFDGEYYRIKDASIAPRSVQQPHIPIYIGGESEQGRALGARAADIFVMNGRPPEQIPELVTNMKDRAQKHGRTIRFGMGGFVICRETETAANEEFRRLLALRHMQIKGADKKVVMHQVQPHDAEKVGTNGGTTAGLVGTPEMIAERLRQFESLGIETFLLQFHPTLEEMQRFGTEVMPLLKN